jgi:DNA-binding transcriptional ArsR family regulator
VGALREAVDIVRGMSEVQAVEAAVPMTEDVWELPHRPGAPSSVVRLLSRMRAYEPDVWYGLLADLERSWVQPIVASSVAPVAAGPMPVVMKGRTWTLSAEVVRQAFVEFRSLKEVVTHLGLARTSVYDHVSRFRQTHVVETRRRGRIKEYRIGAVRA